MKIITMKTFRIKQFFAVFSTNKNFSDEFSKHLEYKKSYKDFVKNL